ncbi:hypothetical protein GCM10027275_21300 [Rhabdobacter roseus]|uniref:peptidylprolyl isomerase n=1 Tax=Rhabdobacter roseus TaxID=1655419 RepID=A0A840TMA8_9BACT|nr:FKBP-type peptidyl-prolyl cis-trans isomerase [Rhabdobacter roseus]MBB5284065.1 hypothetical protein [Rhabdobacter roseus]
MQAKLGKMVELHLTVQNAQGEVLFSTQGFAPERIVLGAGTLLPALEASLIGRSEGDEVEVALTPDQVPHDEASAAQRSPWEQLLAQTLHCQLRLHSVRSATSQELLAGMALDGFTPDDACIPGSGCC